IFDPSDYEVFEADNIIEGFQLIGEHEIQLVLVDWMMPLGPGIDLARKVRAEIKDRYVYLIMVTAKEGRDAMVQGLESGVDDYVSRPFSPRELRARVRIGERVIRTANDLQRLVNRIEQAKQEWEATADAISQLVCLLDRDGIIIRANRAAESWGLGWMSDVTGKSLWGLLHSVYPDFSAQIDGVWTVVQERIDRDLGFEMAGDDLGSGYHFLVQFQPITRDDYRKTSEASYAAVSIFNITERRNLELALQEANDQLAREHAKSESLLLNILPEPISLRLKQEEDVIADEFESVSVLFTDLVGFTAFAATITPRELVQLLNEIVLVFDQLCAKYGVEKIKTIGDSYMAVCGLPLPNDKHAQIVVDLALDMMAYINKFVAARALPIHIRIGIHSGPVVAGVIGSTKFAYDLWGDTVNIASRMQSTGVPGAVHISEQTAQQLGGGYTLARREAVMVKGKGEMQTYLVTRVQATDPQKPISP
ncbi:MAG: adenylate/guanylate cyclase domain-containing protein, partial [Phototrophicaceae bacterium]